MLTVKGGKDAVLDALCDNIESMTSRHAAHVWIRLFKKGFPLAAYKKISEAGSKSWHEIAVTETGSTLMLKMLASTSSSSSSSSGGGRADFFSDVRRDCLDNVNKVTCSAYGSLVMLQLVQGGPNALSSKVIKQANTFVLNEYAVKVVERVYKLAHVSTSSKSPLIDFLTADKNGSVELSLGLYC